MISRYSQLVYVPSRRDRFHLIPVRRVKWGKIFDDINNAWNWLREKVLPTPNPFDLAWQQAMEELLWETA